MEKFTHPTHIIEVSRNQQQKKVVGFVVGEKCPVSNALFIGLKCQTGSGYIEPCNKNIVHKPECSSIVVIVASGGENKFAASANISKYFVNQRFID